MDGDIYRKINNFWHETTGGQFALSDVVGMKSFHDYMRDHAYDDLPKRKVALLFICLNEPYWPFVKDVVADARKFFLPGHEVDFLLWSDMKEPPEGVQLFPTEPIAWPYPTLFRYHTMLQQEEKLAEYDYLFYIDVDMRIVSYVGDEILGVDGEGKPDGLTAAAHPMYFFKDIYFMPFEPNPESTAYVPYPKQYYAGGFQGGETQEFIEAMKVMRKNIDTDLEKINYRARWNDESHWNPYLIKNPPKIFLDPGYIYPDSLHEEYYTKIWGRDFSPKIVTLTKKFTLQSMPVGEVQNRLDSA